uniref:Pyridine nucleotide-disulfide oxidoreductase n=1 Tax=Thermogemmatispora argillosa TaxID=2045280 RepID=A0A455SUY3_9CHLR|nr:pyridine nucleotide-disulfide oxidoreductase [Thermogemmatispora argillosa]
MPRQIIIIGGGVGGTITANMLARQLRPHEAEITLIDSTGRHVYMPFWLYMPFSDSDPQSHLLVRDERTLLHQRVHLLIGQVQQIDVANHQVHVYQSSALEPARGKRESILVYDDLVLATGARLALADLPGLEEGQGVWHHFYDTEGALRLRQALSTFPGGRIVIAVAGIPYRCPPAPLEFTFLLDDWLRQHCLREHTVIEYLYPLPRVFTIERVAEMVAPLLEEREIATRVFFTPEAVDQQRRVIRSLEGEEVPFDLLILVPPHRGAQVIEASGLGDSQGWIPTDRHTLQVKGQEHVYALGDATDLPVPKSGSAAHFEARVLARRLVAAIRGEALEGDEGLYDGEVMCFLETGNRRATQLVFNYEHPPEPPRPSLFYHLEKQLLNHAYWHLIPQGLI